MSGYQNAMYIQRYVNANARADNCHGCALKHTDDAGARGGPIRYKCKIGGFLVTRFSRCDLYRPADGLPSRVTRPGDMSPEQRLTVTRQDDGDIIIRVDDKERSGRIVSIACEFCAPGTGGGRSQRTRQALMDLMMAIQQDNQERPL